MYRYVCTYQLGGSVGSPVDVGCTGTCVPISWVEGLELLKMFGYTGTPVSIGWFDVLGEICC